MEPCSKELREWYTFFDFLFYTCLLVVPLVNPFAPIKQKSRLAAKPAQTARK